MTLLRKIRANSAINKIFREVLKRTSLSLDRIIHFFVLRWPVSGIIQLHFNGIDFRMFSRSDDGIVNYFYYGANYEEHADLLLFIQLANRSSNVLDIGANTGLFSILVGLSNPSARVSAFEPYSVNAQRLLFNLNLNKIKNVQVIEKAIGETVGEIEMAVPKTARITDVSSVNGEFSKSVYSEISWELKPVGVTTLDREYSNETHLIDLIKCDVETYEMSVFKGAFNLLEKHRPTILFECFLDEERRLFFNGIARNFDYHVYLIFAQGIVYSPEGMVHTDSGLNYLLSPVKPSQTFIKFGNWDAMAKAILLRPLA